MDKDDSLKPAGSLPPNADDAAMDPDQDVVEKVFDISPDFKISPIQENPEPVLPKQTAPTKPTPTTNLKPAVPPIPPPIVASVQPPTQLPPRPVAQGTFIQPSEKGLSGTFWAQPSLQDAVSAQMPAPVIKASAIKPQPYKDLAGQPSDIKPLRTYEGDIAEVLARRNPSVTSIAIAEHEKKGDGNMIGNDVPAEPDPETHSAKKIIMVIASLVIVLAGAAGGYYLYNQSPLKAAQITAPAPAIQTPQSLVPADSRVVISIDGLGQAAIASRIRAELAKPQTPNTLKEIVLSETQNGQQVRASTADVSAVMGIPVPDMIMRTLSPQWMLGESADGSGRTTLSVIVKTDFFQNAFAGMLQWESTMPQDLQQYVSSTSAQFAVLQGQFMDRIVKNTDVREFVATDNNTVFLYSFINNSTLVVTGNENALADIITRLEQQAFIR